MEQKKSNVSKAGFVLALIGGIFGILMGLIISVLGGVVLASMDKLPPGSTISTGMIAFAMGLGIYYVISSILVIIGGVWMKNPEKCLKGGIVTLIFSVVGGGTLLGIIGGILGIVATSKSTDIKSKLKK